MLSALSAALLLSFAPPGDGDLHWPVLQAKAYTGIPSHFGGRLELFPVDGVSIEGGVGGTLLGPNIWSAGARWRPDFLCAGCEDRRGVSWRAGIGGEYWGFWGAQAVDEGLAVLGPNGMMGWRFAERFGMTAGAHLLGGVNFTLDGTIVDPTFVLLLEVGLVLY